MSTDLRELFDSTGRTPAVPAGWDPDDVVARGRRLRARRRAAVASVALATGGVLAAGAVLLLGPPAPTAVAPGTGPSASTGTSAPSSPSPSTSSTDPSPEVIFDCTASDVTLTLGEPGAAAGTTYYPVLVKAVPGARCTLSGVPFVTVETGSGQGERASVSGTAATSVTLDGSVVGSFSVGIASSANYDQALCAPVPAERLEVVLPGDTQTTGAQTPVALPRGVTLCSGDVSSLGAQVLVTPVVGGPDGS